MKAYHSVMKVSIHLPMAIQNTAFEQFHQDSSRGSYKTGLVISSNSIQHEELQSNMWRINCGIAIMRSSSPTLRYQPPFGLFSDSTTTLVDIVR